MDFGSQVSLNSSTQENEAYVGRETGTMDKFGVVRTISKEVNTPGQSRDFAIMTTSELQTGESRNRGLGNALADPEVDNEKTSRQRVKARISTSTKLPGTDRVTPPLVTPLVDNAAALEQALNNIVDSLGEQNEQMSTRMSELERAVHIERESLREEINRNRQEVGRSEKRLKERTDEHMAKNLSRMTREAEQRELRLRDDMEKLRIQQEQSLGTLDTKIDAMMERRTQAIMDRLDGLLSSKSGPKEGEPNSGGPSREPRVNFNEHQKKKTYGSTRGRGSSSGYATRGNGAWGPNSRASSTGNRQTSNERTTQGTHATGRSDSGDRGHASLRRSHVGQAGNTHGDLDCRDAPHTEPLTRCEDNQAGHSRDATAMATAFEPLNRSLETFLTRLSRTNERSQKSRRVFKKSRCYKDESDGCIDTWIEVMKLHFEEEDLEGHFKSDCPQFWDAVADIKHPRHEEALSGVKASKARLLSEAEARRKDKPQELAAKKMQAVTEETREPEPATAADDFKIDYKAAARGALSRVQQELATKEIEQKVKLELENEKLQEQLNTFEATEFEETKAPRSLSMKLNVISGQRFGMVPQGSKIQSIISVAGHQVIRNLSEPSEFTLMHLDTYADYLRQVEPRTESRAVRALLTTGGPRMKKLHGRYLEVYGPYQVMLNVDGISIYTRTYVTTDDDQMGQIYLGEEELKVRRIGHDAMMEQDAVHIGYEADVTANLLDTNGTKLGVIGLLDTGAVVSVMPIKTWERMGFTREDLIPTNLRLAAANRGAIYVTGRTPITVLHMGGRDLWMSFLVVENLDDADQFILGRDFVRNFDVMIDLNNGLIRIRNPDRKYVKRPINRIITDENKLPIFLDRKVKLQPGQAVVAIFRMRNLNSLSDSKQVCLVPNPNSQSSVILGRSFSVTRNGLCVSVLLNTLDTTVSIQRGKKLGYALPMRTDYEETQNLKKYSVKDCPNHANKDKILKRINELKSIHKMFSMKSETDDGLSSSSNFPERPSSYELESDKPVLPEIEYLKWKIGEGDFKKLRDLLNRNADVFSKHKAEIGCCNFVKHEIELEEGAVPHREGARRMTPHKSEACRAEIEMLLEYDMIEPSKLPWACGVVMAKKKGGSLDFVATFVT